MGSIVQNQRNGAKGGAFPCRLESLPQNFVGEIIANQQRLPRADQVLHQMIPDRARALGKAHPVHDFDFEADFFRFVILEGDEEAADVEQAPHFRIDSFEQRIQIERRAERAADFVQNVKLLGAA